MAFTVTPTSGTAPYVLNINFAEKSRIDGVNYIFRLLVLSSSGSCPPMGSGGILPTSAQLLANNTLTIPSNVPMGSCSTYTARIVNASGAVVSQAMVNISNI